MSKTIEITLDNHCNKVIQTELESSEYEDVSEVLHEARLMIERKRAKSKLQTEL